MIEGGVIKMLEKIREVVVDLLDIVVSSFSILVLVCIAIIIVICIIDIF